MITLLHGHAITEAVRNPAQADNVHTAGTPTRTGSFSSLLDQRQAQSTTHDAAATGRADAQADAAQQQEQGDGAAYAETPSAVPATAPVRVPSSPPRLLAQSETDPAVARQAGWMASVALLADKRIAPAAASSNDTASAPGETADPAKQAATLGLIATLFAPLPHSMPTTVPAPATPAVRQQAALLADRIAATANAQPAVPAAIEQASAGHGTQAALPTRAATTDEGSAPSSVSLAASKPVDAATLQSMQASPSTQGDTLRGDASGRATALQAAATTGSRSDSPGTLLELLGQRLQFQNSQGVQHAQVRLEPYMAGTVHVEIRHEAGALQIHLSASHDDVVRQLQSAGESLRQELNNRQFTEVSVQVSQHRRDGGQGRHDQDDHKQNAPSAQPGRALGEDGDDRHYADLSMTLHRLADVEPKTR